MYMKGLKLLEWLHAPRPACQLTNLAPFQTGTSLQKHRLHCWASTPTAYVMSFTAPVIRQQTPVYHEVTFFFASNDPHTISTSGEVSHSMSSNPQRQCTNTGALHTQLSHSYTSANDHVQICTACGSHDKTWL